MPTNIANITTFLASTSNFSSKGVLFSSFEFSTKRLILPLVIFSPTPIKTAFPLPLAQSVPDAIIGDKLFLFDF